MTDTIIKAGTELEIVIESVRSLILLVIIAYLLHHRSSQSIATRPGWLWVVSGFTMFFVSSVLDVTDNFPGLSSFVIIGDTPAQAFLEEGITGLGGIIMIMVGLFRWIPAVSRLDKEIAKRERVETALRLSDSRFHAFMDNLPAAVSLKDRDGRYLLVNSAYERRSGLGADQIVGLKARDFLSAEEAKFTQVHDDAVAASRKVLVEERDMELRKDQFTPTMITKFPVYGSEGGFEGVGAINTDISERRDAELARERLIGDLRDKNAELERFAYAVSHDLKSPLITIGGFIGVMEKRLGDGDYEGISSDLGRIRNAAGNMQDLLDDVLELSRIGRVVNEFAWYPLNELIDEATERVHARLEQTSTKLSIPAELPKVYVDSRRIVEVLQNIFENSTKFFGDTNQPEISVSADRKGAFVHVAVSDNGIGIDTAYTDKVFGLFERLDQNAEGTGVGLAIVKRIIESHNGQIRLQSAGIGKGTTVHFTLPAQVDVAKAT